MRRRRAEYAIALVMAGALSLLGLLGVNGTAGAKMAMGEALFPLDALGVIGLIVVFGVLNALFVAAETAISMLRPIHVKHVKEGKRNAAQHLQELMDNRPKYATACALGSRTSWLGLTLLVLILALGYGVHRDAQGVAVFDTQDFFVHLLIVSLPVALLTMVVGDLVPKSYATLHPHGVGLRLYSLIRVARVIFSLPATALVALASQITRIFGGKASFSLPNEAEEEIKILVESAEETGEIAKDERELLHSVFEFTDTVAREVMTPRVDLDAMPVKSSPEEIMRVMRESGHTRIPLYEETDDQIVGIIHAKDLLMALVDHGDKVDVRSLVRPPAFVPEGKNLHELLAEMRISRSHMAIVQDEYGGTAGIVTVEDIVEELVGDIVDEYDVEEPDVVESDGAYMVDGKTHIDDVNHEIGSTFESDEFDTIGGFVFGLFGRQPRLADTIETDGFRFTVAETDGRRVQKLRIDRVLVTADSAEEAS